jgi:hypothetical protein
MVQILARIFLVTLPLGLTMLPAPAHDTWISRQGLKNAAGEWCCGVGDCAVMDRDAVRFTPTGYHLSGFGTIDGAMREFYREAIPAGEAQPSPDGAFWRCKRPDGSRRCFFAPPPGS